MAKGYARIELNQYNIQRLECIKHKAEYFIESFREEDFMISKTRKTWFGLSSENYMIFDDNEARSKAPLGVYIWLNWDRWVCEEGNLIKMIRKILQIAKSGSNECYYDQDLCEVINKYARL